MSIESNHTRGVESGKKRKITKIKLNLVIKVAHDEEVPTNEILQDFIKSNPTIFKDGKKMQILDIQNNMSVSF